MKVEELFLRCWLCRGFSSNSGRHLLAYLQKHTVADFQQLPHICQIVPRYQALFMEDFYQVPWKNIVSIILLPLIHHFIRSGYLKFMMRHRYCFIKVIFNY